MTAEAALQAIISRAGLKGARAVTLQIIQDKKLNIRDWGVVPVFFAEPARECKPPTLQRVRLDALCKAGTGKHGRNTRRVIVGRVWLQTHEPTLWAAFVVPRLLNSPEKVYVPSDLTE